jgi:hypothetical protein
MAMQSLTMMRCERCRAIVSNAEAPAMIRAGTPCGVCGGVLALARPHGRATALEEGDDAAPSQRSSSTARRGGMLPRRR